MTLQPKRVLTVVVSAILAGAGLGGIAAGDGPLDPAALVAMAVSIVLFGTMFHYRKEIAEALRNFRGGGPRTPSHPLPANDSVVLRRRIRSTFGWNFPWEIAGSHKHRKITL